jgi:signal transduction histidine kinase
MPSLLEGAVLAPHGFCLSWEPGLIALHVVSDGIIAASYYSIPLALALLLYRRRDISFSWMGWLFVFFILACGTTHVMGIWTLWQPVYLGEGAVKGVTAFASVMTAVALWPLLPRIMSLPSLATLLAANEQLQVQIRHRDAAVSALRRETEERQHAEERARQSQKMEAIGQLTGGIAHDFNNLLQVVQANLEALESRLPASDQSRRNVERALRSVTKGAALTQQLLAFARRQPLSPVVFDVSQRVAKLATLLKSVLGGTIEVEISERDGVWRVEADPNQLDAALLNLALNARDAMPDGGKLIVDMHNMTIDSATPPLFPELEPADYVTIAVTDTGCGMTKEVCESAFEPFFTTKSVGQGSGLGLSQVYGFVKQSHGHVVLESQPGRGTTVTLFLRRASWVAGVQPSDYHHAPTSGVAD